MAARVSAVFHKPVEAAYSSRRSSSSSSILPSSPMHSPHFLRPSSHNKSRAWKAPLGCVKPCGPPTEHLENETMKIARKQFYEEITFRKSDDTISLAKAAFLISAEDEAYLSANKEKDILAMQQEGRGAVLPPKAFPADALVLEGESLTAWLRRVDSIADEVQASLDITANTDPLYILGALQSFTKRSSLSTDPKHFYLHHVLQMGSGIAIMLAILCIETCQRLGLKVQGAPLGEDFILWPSEHGSKIKEGKTMRSKPIAEIVFEPFKGEKTSSENADNSQPINLAAKKLEPVTNRAILTILLRNMKRLYWRRANRALSASELSAPLHPLVLAAQQGSGLVHGKEPVPGTLLRPHDLRLAVAASEKLLLLQPQDWLIRRDHGLLLYHSKRYGEAVQELSICMAVAPIQEVQLLEPFVEKLHLLRVESSWASSSFTPNAPSPLA